MKITSPTARQIRRMIAVWLTSYVILFTPTSHAGNTETPLDITVAVYSYFLADIRKYSQDHHCLDYQKMGLVKNVTLNELSLMCRAFDAADFAVNTKWQAHPMQERMVRSIDAGNAVIGGAAIWGRDATERVYVSDNLLNSGEYAKGIYAPKEKLPGLLDEIKANGFKNLTGVTDKTWFYDVQALDCLQSKRYYGVTYHTMFKMVDAERADFTLMHFSSLPDQSHTVSDITLNPLPGYKISFDDSLNFFVSKSHPDGQRVFAALQKGLAILRKQGVITQAYQAAGFLPDQDDKRVEIGCHR
ncbi:hypothetical protein [uncultured Gilvimarinus sp.]|uniref:hypothetical protein n=1 Tax=uncultured Gilvimarinus sp. TaxID=1689143 RepID=UPI0030DC1557